MYYDFAITVPADRAETSLLETELKLTHGIIHRVEVQFPIGTRALTHCRLEHHTFGHLPTNPSGSFATDGYTISIDENLEFFSEPYIVKAVCWNDDDTHAHTVTVRIGILESRTAIFFMGVMKGLAKMLKLMGIKV